MVRVAMSSNGEYDREFITAVTSTGIYCLPSCRARKPKPENMAFYRTPDEAREAGFRACKKCRPDEVLDGIDSQLKRLDGALQGLLHAPLLTANSQQLASLLGVGQSKLYELMKYYRQQTPMEFLNGVRIDRAAEALVHTDRAVLDIAGDVGFETASTFYNHFSERIGMAPLMYRRLRNSDDFEIALPEGFRDEIVLNYFARDENGVNERVVANRLDLPLWFDDEPRIISITFEANTVTCRNVAGVAVKAHEVVSRIIGVSQNPRAFERKACELGHQRLIENRVGLRVPQTPTIYDGMVWAIVGQQVNLAFAYLLRRRLSEKCGVQLEGRLFAPPRPQDVAQLDPKDLIPLQFSHRKAEYVIGISRQIVDGTLNISNLALSSPASVEKTLLKVRGLGPWSVNYLMMRAFGFSDCVPVGDTGITSALQRYFELTARPDSKKTLELLEPFSPYRSLACLHLWQIQKQPS